MVRCRRRGDARGLSESVQWAVLTPLVLLVVLGLVHAGILLHGRSVAASAALAGAEAAALSGAGVGSGERVAREVASGGGLLGVEVRATVDGAVVRVEVTGRVASFLPGQLDDVASTAEQPTEVPR